MQKAFLTAATMLLLMAPTSADPSQAGKPAGSPLGAKPPPPATTLPFKGTMSHDSCADLGAGFVKVEGSDTCVKLGGSLSVGAGGSR